jgi:predicted ATPase/DNA-binding SARP family transcriptional activator
VGRVHVDLLGPVTLDVGDGPVAIGGPRLRALLARLALDAGRSVRPEALFEAVWSDGSPADAANALHTLVSRLRRVLGDPGRLTSGPAGYRLAVEPEAVDAVRFERAARAGRALLAEGRHAAAAATLREALALWRGPALADVPFPAEAARLERARLAALADRADADLAVGADPDLVAELYARTAEHPLDERLHALLLRALAGCGRSTEALAVHQGVRARLVDAFGAEPGPELQAAHLAVLRGEVPQAGAPALGNLDVPSTSFVGRAADVHRVVELLGSARLVTLVGPGGVGKTRLATTCGRGLTPAGGVWFVALAAAGPEDVARAVLDVLPARPTADAVVDRLVEALAGDDVVLVLDNCEHVVDAAAVLVEALLARCPRLRVLATSREPLRIGGEHLHPVPSLDLPASTRLFRDRAAAVAPGCDPAGPVLDEICARLDGLPLAIELAAARLRTLPVEAVAARLDDRFRLLTGGSRTALPRHRTLAAVVAWSWDLLTADERVLLERLSVVPGTITEDAARAVGGLDDAAELMAALVDKSLVQLVAGDRPRYRILETIREYGLARLPDADAVRARHGAHCLELAETAEPLLRTRDQLHWLAEIAVERDNLLATLRWTIEQGDAATAVRFGAALAWYWTMQDNPPESAELLGSVLALPGPADPTARAVVVAAHALGVIEQPQYAAAAARRIAEALAGEDPGSHPVLGMARLAARIVAPGALPGVADVPRDPWRRSFDVLVEGMLAGITGDHAAAEHLLPRALAGFEELGERWGAATAASMLGSTLRRSGDPAAALVLNRRADRYFDELGMGAHSAENEAEAALIRGRSGDVPGALRQLAGMLERAATAELRAVVRLTTAQLEHQAGRPDRAREHAELALAAGMPGDEVPTHVTALLVGLLAELDAADGRPADARRRLAHPAVRLMSSWQSPVAAELAAVVARIELSRGRPELAAQLLAAARALGSVDDGRLAAEISAAAPGTTASPLSRAAASELVAAAVQAADQLV